MYLLGITGTSWTTPQQLTMYNIILDSLNWRVLFSKLLIFQLFKKPTAGNKITKKKGKLFYKCQLQCIFNCTIIKELIWINVLLKSLTNEYLGKKKTLEMMNLVECYTTFSSNIDSKSSNYPFFNIIKILNKYLLLTT